VPGERLVNRRTVHVGSDPDQLTQLVLREDVTTPTADGFGRIHAVQYQELAIVDGVYMLRLWTRSDSAIVVDTTATPFTAGPWVVPTRRGNRFRSSRFRLSIRTASAPTSRSRRLEIFAIWCVAHFRDSCDHDYGLF
jgi:hypothetical protein